MQWSSGKNGGFSDAAASRLPAPVVDSGYSPEHVNASEQRHDPDSMLQFMRKLIERFRSSAEIGWGSLQVIDQNDSTVFMHSVEGAEGRMIAVHNLGSEAVTVSATVPGLDETFELVDLLVDGVPVTISRSGRVEIALDGYGYRWLRVLGPTGKRLY
jgi:glycosidase